MALTDSYRKQHVELLEIATSLSTKLNRTDLEKDANSVIKMLSQFASKLNIHLSMEDKALYPKLLNSNNKDAAKIAKDFQTEMGGIKQVFEKYTNIWSTEKSIISNADQFIADTKGLLTALKARIDKENSILYPTADKL